MRPARVPSIVRPARVDAPRCAPRASRATAVRPARVSRDGGAPGARQTPAGRTPASPASACRGVLTPPLHGVTLARAPRPVHRTMVRGVQGEKLSGPLLPPSPPRRGGEGGRRGRCCSSSIARATPRTMVRCTACGARASIAPCSARASGPQRAAAKNPGWGARRGERARRTSRVHARKAPTRAKRTMRVHAELWPRVDGAVKSCWPMACLYRSLRFGEEYLPVSALLVDKT